MRQRARALLLATIGLLFVLSVPWYRDAGEEPALWGGLPAGDAAAIATIGGADGPMILFTSLILSPELFVPITVVAYLYLGLTYGGYPYLIRLLVPRRLRGLPMPVEPIRRGVSVSRARPWTRGHHRRSPSSTTGRVDSGQTMSNGPRAYASRVRAACRSNMRVTFLGSFRILWEMAACTRASRGPGWSSIARSRRWP